jgi:hypothetical protein
LLAEGMAMALKEISKPSEMEEQHKKEDRIQ